MFSHECMFFGILLCNSQETCLLPFEMGQYEEVEAELPFEMGQYEVEAERWNSERDWKTNKSVTNEVLILKGKRLLHIDNLKN